QTLDQVFNQSTSALRCLVDRSKDLTEELENGLNSVRGHIASIQSEHDRLQSAKISGKIGRFLKPKSAAGLDQTNTDPTIAIDSMRATIDFVLGKLGEMFALLNSSQEQFYSNRDE